MQLNIEKIVEDVRGKIIFLKYGDLQINLVEIKMGFARGGHYHKNATKHILLSGKIQYYEEDIDGRNEVTKTISAPSIIDVSPRKAHLLKAIENTIFLEYFDKGYEATVYPKYRQEVEKSIKQKTD